MKYSSMRTGNVKKYVLQLLELNTERIFMNLKDLTDSFVPMNTPVKLLINGVKMDIAYVYEEDFSNGALQVVLVGKVIDDKNN